MPRESKKRASRLPHPDRARLLDHIERHLDSGAARDVAEHLGGCERCRRTLRELERLVQDLRGRSLESPPDWLVAWTEDLPRSFPRRKAVPAARTWRLVFDSWRMIPAGARSRSPGLRRLVYRAGNVDLDLQLEGRPGSRSILHGQILDASVPGGRTYSGGDVRLIKGRKVVASTTLDERGEFFFASVPADRYTLRIEAGACRCRVSGLEV